MKNSYSKSSFHKLYLIEKDMYDRILPYLNEVDKQEIDDLNMEHRPELDESEQIVEAEVEDELTQSNNTETEIDEREPDREVYREIPREVPSPEINEENSTLPNKRPKKYRCEICVNKMYTTKSSLKRHHKTFHVLRQPINKTDNDNSIIQNKRKREVDDDNIAYPEEKIKKYVYSNHDLELSPMKKELKRKSQNLMYEPEPPKKIVHLNKPDDQVIKYDSDLDEKVEQTQMKRGIKRKGPKRATDLEPRKKLHWETY